MKRLVFTILAFFALSNFAFASDVNFATISKTDTQFLFKDKSVKVLALNENELKETQGAWGWLRNIRNIFVLTKKYIQIDGYNGSRIFQIRWKKRPIFRVDYKANPSPTKLHFHFGNMKYHRPWYAPWRKY